MAKKLRHGVLHSANTRRKNYNGKKHSKKENKKKPSNQHAGNSARTHSTTQQLLSCSPTTTGSHHPPTPRSDGQCSSSEVSSPDSYEEQLSGLCPAQDHKGHWCSAAGQTGSGGPARTQPQPAGGVHGMRVPDA